MCWTTRFEKYLRTDYSDRQNQLSEAQLVICKCKHRIQQHYLDLVSLDIRLLKIMPPYKHCGLCLSDSSCLT